MSAFKWMSFVSDRDVFGPLPPDWGPAIQMEGYLDEDDDEGRIKKIRAYFDLPNGLRKFVEKRNNKRKTILIVKTGRVA